MKTRLLSLIFILLAMLGYADDPLRILVMIPTRENPEQFIQTLNNYYYYLSGETDTRFLITCDFDDQTMNNDKMLQELGNYPNLTIKFGKRVSETEAYNRNFENCDVLIVASDCSFPIVQGYDKIIADKMLQFFPNMDGVLNFQLKDSGKNFITNPVMGIRHYEFFNYIYHPSYRARTVANEELTMVSRILAKEEVIFQPMFEKVDSLRIRNKTKDSAYNDYDKNIYQGHFNNAFGLDEEVISQFLPKTWSILICTLDEREQSFKYLYNKLQQQIADNGLQDKVEVLSFCDNRQYSIGFKRNALMRQSKGAYVNFIDDDDDVHENYVGMIYEALQTKPDCVSLTGIITFNGSWPCYFIHAIAHKDHYKKGDIFYNPPNHISTIKRSIAVRFPFPDISYGEDYNWSMQICRSGLLKTEATITTPYYFYKYVDK